jgi:hypothetical protein
VSQDRENWKPWLRKVGEAALSGMSEDELRADPDGGFHVALNAMRAAHRARAAAKARG